MTRRLTWGDPNKRNPQPNQTTARLGMFKPGLRAAAGSSRGTAPGDIPIPDAARGLAVRIEGNRDYQTRVPAELRRYISKD